MLEVLAINALVIILNSLKLAVLIMSQSGQVRFVATNFDYLVNLATRMKVEKPH
jgi:hypothetical protein